MPSLSARSSVSRDGRARLCARHARRQRGEPELGVGDDADVGLAVAADLLGVDVELDERLARAVASWRPTRGSTKRVPTASTTSACGSSALGRRPRPRTRGSGDRETAPRAVGRHHHRRLEQLGQRAQLLPAAAREQPPPARISGRSARPSAAPPARAGPGPASARANASGSSSVDLADRARSTSGGISISTGRGRPRVQLPDRARAPCPGSRSGVIARAAYLRHAGDHPQLVVDLVQHAAARTDQVGLDLAGDRRAPARSRRRPSRGPPAAFSSPAPARREGADLPVVRA